jgi:hypothetical protein
MRMANSCWPPQVVRFLKSPDGLAFLHQLLAAAHLVFVQANDCGIRNLCWFLKISGLDEFIALGVKVLGRSATGAGDGGWARSSRASFSW